MGYSENVRIVCNRCTEHWLDDLRRSNAILNDTSIEELVKHFELFDFSGKKNHQNNKKKDNNTVKFKNKNSKKKFFHKNDGNDTTQNTKKYKLN